MSFKPSPWSGIEAFQPPLNTQASCFKASEWLRKGHADKICDWNCSLPSNVQLSWATVTQIHVNQTEDKSVMESKFSSLFGLLLLLLIRQSGQYNLVRWGYSSHLPLPSWALISSAISVTRVAKTGRYGSAIFGPCRDRNRNRELS